MGSADTGEVRQSGLDFRRGGAPGRNAVNDVGGKVGLLAVAVRVGIRRAPGRSNPGVQTLG